MKLPSFQSDPVYANAVLTANRDFQESQGNIMRELSHGFLQLGNVDFARAFYKNNWLRQKQGKGKNAKFKAITPFEKAQLAAIRANANPETGVGQFAQIGREFNLQQEALNNELNAANLFYSGYRGKKLGELARERQLTEANALFAGQSQLDERMRMLTAARQQRRDALAAAAQSAYTRLLAQQLGA